jgi:hypothetical protein
MQRRMLEEGNQVQSRDCREGPNGRCGEWAMRRLGERASSRDGVMVPGPAVAHRRQPKGFGF